MSHKEVEKKLNAYHESEDKDPQIMAELYLESSYPKLDIFGPFIDNPVLGGIDWYHSVPKEVFLFTIKHPNVLALSIENEVEINEADTEDYTCDEGILEVVKMMNRIGFMTTQSCSGLHLEELKDLTDDEKYEKLKEIDKTKGVRIHSHIGLAAENNDALLSLTLLLEELSHSCHLIQITINQGEYLFEPVESKYPLVNIWLSVYFWNVMKEAVKTVEKLKKK